MPKNVRAKFECIGVLKKAHWDRKGEKDTFLYEAEFQAVYTGSPENEKFFDATPSGTIKLATLKDDHFVPGTEYYIDFSPATEAAESVEAAAEAKAA